MKIKSAKKKIQKYVLTVERVRRNIIKNTKQISFILKIKSAKICYSSRKE